MAEVFVSILPCLTEEGGSQGALFLIQKGKENSVSIMLKAKVTLYVVPNESHYANTSVSVELIGSEMAPNPSPDTSKFSAVSTWFLLFCQVKRNNIGDN